MSLYLDHCATTPADPEVLAAMAHARAELFGNPSSIHEAGRRARAALESARARLAAALGAQPGEIVLTASGSEANNLALKGALLAAAPGPAHLVVSAIEHDSVLRAAHWLEHWFNWISVTEVAPGPSGRIDPADVARALCPTTRLVSVMHVNNETGVIQPVAEIARLAHRHGALFHTDAAQSLGRLPVDAAALGCDLLSLTAHKFYGPKGAGLLCVRAGTPLEPQVHGGSQEGRRRAGTENLAAVAGMALATELAQAGLAANGEAMQRLEAVFLDALRAAGIPFEINGEPADKVPGVLNIAVAGIQQVDWVVGLDLAGVAVSAGAACSSGVIEPSHVLRAMGLHEWRTRGGVRISFGRGNTPEDAREAARRMGELYRRLRAGERSEGAMA